jgi:hypothetical protein
MMRAVGEADHRKSLRGTFSAFGFIDLCANRRRAALLPLCFHLLGSAPQAEQDISGSKAPSDLWLCPKCGGPMMVIERLTAAEIQFRSPPALVTEAA